MKRKRGIKELIRGMKIKKSSHIALIIDGSKINLNEMEPQLSKIKMTLEEVGKIQSAKIIFKNLPSDELSKIIQNLGFDISIYVSETDVYFVLEAMELIYNPKVEAVAIATKNEEFLPLLTKGKEKGKKIIAINLLDSKLDAETLTNLCDIIIDLNKSG